MAHPVNMRKELSPERINEVERPSAVLAGAPKISYLLPILTYPYDYHSYYGKLPLVIFWSTKLLVPCYNVVILLTQFVN